MGRKDERMKIFKRNQLIILVISLMLITAGYLNFTAKGDSTMETTGPIAELGDATLVNGNIVEENKSDIGNTNEAEEGSNKTNQGNNTEETSSNTIVKNQDQYFTKTRLERDTMFSQMLETYQELYNNPNSTSTQKTQAMKEISKISSLKNGIMIAENLIMVKGFEDLIIFVNEGSTSVIIKALKDLTPEQIAQIQNIVSRELNVGVETINISRK